MSTKPEILIVHGAWSYPASYSKFTALLESRGFIVHIPELPSVNEDRPPTADFASDTAHIRQYATDLADSGRSIIVLLYSYGGHVGTNALSGLGIEARRQKNLPGGIERLVYICGSAFNIGETMLDMVEKHGHMDLIPIAFPSQEDGTCVCSDPRTIIVGEGVSDEEYQDWLSTSRVWNGSCMATKLEHCAWLEIPVSYVLTTNDVLIPFVYQTDMVANIEARTSTKVQTFTLETGHCRTLTKTEELVSIVEEIVGNVSA